MSDFTYAFRAIGDHLGIVRRVDLQKGKELTLSVAARDQHLAYWSSTMAPPQVADMVDLALSVHIADRFSTLTPGQTTHIHVTLPVRRPDLLGDSKILTALIDVLYWYTKSVWSFTFEPRTEARRPAERQATFTAHLHDELYTEVALWSGGLDSFAGLWQRQSHRPDMRFVLCGTGPNLVLLKRQRDLARHVRVASSAPIELRQVPLVLSTPHRTCRNRYHRSRGFVFLMLGAVCAYLEGQSMLHIYENGIGALNLPFRPAEVGMDHARSVHPLSLLKMGELVSLLLGSHFTFVNPFLFQTKAEICAPLLDTAGEALIYQTISCDSQPRRRGLPTQCGRCSSCFLRRQALATLGVLDQTPYAYSQHTDPDNRFTLELMLEQCDFIRNCLAAPEPWKALRCRYQDLERTVTRVATAIDIPRADLIMQILGLYKRYVDEWNRIQHVLGSGDSSLWLRAA